MTMDRRPTRNRYVMECEHCGPTGFMCEEDGQQAESPACEGTGYLPTNEGLELIDALEALRPWWRSHGQ